MNIIEIKARLYDLQYHNCIGQIILNPDGKYHPEASQPCITCSEILKLRHELYKLERGVNL